MKELGFDDLDIVIGIIQTIDINKLNQLMTDYKKINYNESNIRAYIDIVLFLDLDITNKFIDYIVVNYVFFKIIQMMFP